MTKLIKADLKRAFMSPTLYIALAVYIGCNLYSCYNMTQFLHTYRSSHGAINAFLLGALLPSVFNISNFAAPIVAVLGTGLLYIQDERSGYKNQLLMRASPGRYQSSKMICSAVMGGLTLLLGLLITFGICYIFDPNDSIRVYRRMGMNSFQDLYMESMLGYCVVSMLNITMFGASYAVLSMGISAIRKNQYIAVIAPVMFYLISSLLYRPDSLLQWLSSDSYHMSTNTVGRLIYSHASTMALGIALFFTGNRLEKGIDFPFLVPRRVQSKSDIPLK